MRRHDRRARVLMGAFKLCRHDGTAAVQVIEQLADA
jgi:hypothetical protein